MYIAKQLSRALKSDRTMKAALGLSILEFKDLSISFDTILQEAKSGKKIKKEEIEMESFLKTSELKLFFILFYIQNHHIKELISLLMDLSLKKIDLWIQSLLPLLKTALDKSSCIPEKKIQSIKIFFKINDKNFIKKPTVKTKAITPIKKKLSK